MSINGTGKTERTAKGMKPMNEVPDAPIPGSVPGDKYLGPLLCLDIQFLFGLLIFPISS